MRYQRKDDHSKTCEVDYISVNEPSVIIFDDKPFRVIPASDFEENWEPTSNSCEILSPIVFIDQHRNIANAAIEVCRSFYAMGSTKAKINELREMLNKAGYDWEQPT